jgi:hypothetical protein
MQYLVSVENTSYFYWQLELLIESFAMKGIEDDLVVAVADNDSQKIGGFSANIIRHRNKFVHPNEGRRLGYLPINRIAAIRYAIASGMLKFPFALVHSDMVVRRPLEDFGGEIPSVIVNNFDDIGTDEELVKKEMAADLQGLAESRGVEVKDLPVVPFFSAPIVFNGAFKSISDIFFARLQANLMTFLERRGPEFPCERAAWELTLAESFQYCRISGQFMSSSMTFDSDAADFIHYKTGMLPVFHKKFYRYEDGTYLVGQGPFETLMEHNPTVNTDFIQKVIKSYSDSRVRKFRQMRDRQTSHANAHD